MPSSTAAHLVSIPVPTDDLPEGPTSLGVPDGRDLDLWDALGTLPPRQRTAVVQHHLGGLPFVDVATTECRTVAPLVTRRAQGKARQRGIPRRLQAEPQTAIDRGRPAP